MIADNMDIDNIAVNDHGWEDDLEESENFEEEIDNASIVHRIREIVKADRTSPQKKLKFENTVRVALPRLFQPTVQPPSTTHKQTERSSSNSTLFFKIIGQVCGG